MDVLALILRTLRDAIQATGAPPDALQDALDDAERHLRRSLGGALHHISRAPQVPVKARVAALAEAGLGTAQISEQLGVSDRHVRRVLQMLRRGDS